VRIVAGDAVSEFVEIGFADEDGAGIFQRCDNRGVLKRKKIAKKARAASGEKARGVEVVLQRDGYAVKRAEVAAGFTAGLGAKGGFGGGRVFQGHFGIEREIGVEARIQAGDAFEKKSCEFDGRKFPAAIEFSNFRNREKARPASRLINRSVPDGGDFRSCRGWRG